MAWLPGWSHRIPFTIDHDDIDSALDWFPVRVHLSAPSYDSDFLTGGSASADAASEFFPASFAFDNNDATYWSSGDVAMPHWIKYDLGVGVTKTARQLRFYPRFFIHSQVKDFKLQGSNNDSNWTDILDEQTADEDDWQEWEFANPTAYRYYRIYITSNWAASNYAQIHEIELMELIGDNTCVFDEVGANSKKIAFTKSDGVTELYGEIEKWDNTNEEAEIWVSRAGWVISDSEDTVGYLYYDNTHADNDAYIGVIGSRTEVWDDDFVRVFHLADDDTGTIVVDSTGTANATKKTNTEPSQIDAQIGKGQDFDGVDDKITLADADDLDFTTAMTLEAYVKQDTVDSEFSICKRTNGVDAAYELSSDGAGKAIVAIYTGDARKVTAGTHLLTTSLHYLMANYDNAADNLLRLYVDGNAAVTVDTGGGNIDATLDVVTLGWGWSNTYALDGQMDEVRMSKIKRSEAWKNATYESGRDHLVTWGSEEVNFEPGARYQLVNLGVQVYG